MADPPRRPRGLRSVGHASPGPPIDLANLPPVPSGPAPGARPAAPAVQVWVDGRANLLEHQPGVLTFRMPSGRVYPVAEITGLVAALDEALDALARVKATCDTAVYATPEGPWVPVSAVLAAMRPRKPDGTAQPPTPTPGGERG